MRSAISRWLVSVLVILLLMCPHIRMYENEQTRYFAFWDFTDALAIELIVLTLGSLLFGGHALVRRMGRERLDRFAKSVFVLLLGLGLLTNLEMAQTGRVQLAWSPLCFSLTAFVIACSALSLMKRMAWLPRTCGTVCKILTPVIPIVFVQMLLYSTYAVRAETFPSTDGLAGNDPGNDRRINADNVGDTYVFIFDAWSHSQTFDQSDLDSELPNLAALVNQSTVYDDAHSLFSETRRSLPSIIYQSPKQYLPRDGVAYFQHTDGQVEPAINMSSLFDDAKTRGCETYMVGWSHPYRNMLGPQVDYVYSGPSQGCNPNARRFDRTVWRHLKLGLANFTLTVPKPLVIQWPLNRSWNVYDGAQIARARVKSIHSRALRIANLDGGARMAMFHYPLPHGPFLFDRNGYDPTLPVRFPLGETERANGFVRPDPRNHIARYRGNQRYMDTLLGEFVDALKAHGRFERATIILTSDHSWRVDPSFDELCVEHQVSLGGITSIEPPLPQLTHVPLVVKAPHQLNSRRVRQRVQLTSLRNIIEACQSDSPFNRHALSSVRP